MEQNKKDFILDEARINLKNIRDAIRDKIESLDSELVQEYEDYRAIDGETAYEDKLRAVAISGTTGSMQMQLMRLEPSPYFARCDIKINGYEFKSYYFAKFPSSELGIYSWTAPFASMRFDDPGETSYRAPDGTVISAHLYRRDQFMIGLGEIRFMTSEHETLSRQLIYQEHFSTKKDGFVLPEIVAQMERAQDQVIRADHAGAFAISGPAGSGKTTLALHRIAYLRSSPETADLYPSEEILVLVQDARTQEYFSKLLPELGINDIRITTFSEWALSLLDLKKYFHRVRPGNNEYEQDEYEFAKITAATQLASAPKKYDSNIGKYLRNFYVDHMSPNQLDLLDKELNEGALDRHDLTNLLNARMEQDNGIYYGKEHYTFLAGGKVRTKIIREPLRYSLILVDEFQNYLPLQLRLLKSVAAARYGSMLYVGDMAQQTQAGTIGSWTQIGESILPERMIMLNKVYRNTRQILEFINEIGYTVDIPAGLTEGNVPSQFDMDIEQTIKHIKSLSRIPGSTIGVLAKDYDTLQHFVNSLIGRDDIHCLTIREAQGVEFDTVCIVGLDDSTFTVDHSVDAFRGERIKINRDLLYVALTRAITGLNIYGTGNLFQTLKRVTG